MLLGAALGGVAGLALLYLQFIKGLMGAGDVKLLGAIGVWSGALGALYVMVVGSLVGGALALVALAFATRDERREVQANLLHAFVQKELPVEAPSQLPRARGIPFGVALAVTAAGFFCIKGAG